MEFAQSVIIIRDSSHCGRGARPPFIQSAARETINTIFEGSRVEQDNLLISEKISDVTLEKKTSYMFISTRLPLGPYSKICQDWAYTLKSGKQTGRTL